MSWSKNSAGRGGCLDVRGEDRTSGFLARGVVAGWCHCEQGQRRQGEERVVARTLSGGL